MESFSIPFTNRNNTKRMSPCALVLNELQTEEKMNEKKKPNDGKRVIECDCFIKSFCVSYRIVIDARAMVMGSIFFDSFAHGCGQSGGRWGTILMHSLRCCSLSEKDKLANLSNTQRTATQIGSVCCLIHSTMAEMIANKMRAKNAAIFFDFYLQIASYRASDSDKANKRSE